MPRTQPGGAMCARVWALIAAPALALLASCGGGAEGLPRAAVSSSEAPSVKALASTPTSAAASMSVSVSFTLTKIAETRVARTAYDYTFQVGVTNGPVSLTAAAASIIKTGAGTVVMQGGVTVGDLSPGESRLLAGQTVVLRHDRALPFDSAAIQWSVSASDGATATIGAEGGVIATNGGLVSITVPQNALAAKAPITIKKIDVVDPDTMAVTEAMEFGPEGTNFASPVTLRFSALEFPTPEDWLPHRKAVQFQRDGAWVAVPTGYDDGSGVFSAMTDHFSRWTVGGDEIAFPVNVNPDSDPDEINSTDRYYYRNLNCYFAGKATAKDAAYQGKFEALAKKLFVGLTGTPASKKGCMTAPYLLNGYSSLVPTLENHAGIDFSANDGAKVMALASGKVVKQLLCIDPNHPRKTGSLAGVRSCNPGVPEEAPGPNRKLDYSKSTLTLQLTIDGQDYLVSYLHCQKHLVPMGGDVGAGQDVCEVGGVGATATHLHLEVKRLGQDRTDTGDQNYLAMSASRGACKDKKFDNQYNPASKTYDVMGAWGCSTRRIQDNTVDPTSLVATTATLLSVSAADDHTCGIKSNGGVACWGWNTSGQLGDGSTSQRLVPVAVVGIANAVALTTGDAHSCALKSDGGVACWGDNQWGMLGDGTTISRRTPVAVSGLTDAIALASTASHTCALRRSGAVVCWGANFRGQLGDGTVVDRLVPVPVLGLTNAVALAANGGHTCAVKLDGGVECWGQNGGGQLGDGTNEDRNAPVAVVGLTDAVAVAAGSQHTCAVKRGGSVVCWGVNWVGELGDGSLTDRRVPGLVAGLIDAVSVDADHDHTCAVKRDGRLACWGYNASGQLGDGSTVAKLVPTIITSLSEVSSVSAGTAHTCAAKRGGGLECWGSNYYGQLGDGTKTNRLVPGPVSGL